MARREKHLVVQHAEMMGDQLFESYQPVLREFIKGRHGVYALYKKNKLYYVGLATNLRQRVKHHLKDRHAGKWDRFSLFITDSESHLRELEALVLRIANPTGNRATAKLPGSSDLRGMLRRRVQKLQGEQRDVLFGEPAHREGAKKKKKRRRRRGGGELPAAGLVQRSTRIVMTYKGYEYIGKLLKNGKISYGRKLYDSPSGAAVAIAKRPMNGWSHWRIKVDGEWVPLRKLR